MAESPTFKAWHKMKTAELLTGKSIDELVDDAMQPRNLKVEVRESNGWVNVPTE